MRRQVEVGARAARVDSGRTDVRREPAVCEPLGATLTRPRSITMRRSQRAEDIEARVGEGRDVEAAKAEIRRGLRDTAHIETTESGVRDRRGRWRTGIRVGTRGERERTHHDVQVLRRGRRSVLRRVLGVGVEARSRMGVGEGVRMSREAEHG